MLVSKLILFVILSLFCHFQIIPATNIPTPPDDFAISCGSSGSSKASDGRLWIGDSGFRSTLPLQINGRTSSSRTIHHPYITARLSRNEFSYIFRVTPGQKFIRLHFYQDSYKGFKGSKAMFTVKAGSYTLLTDFSIPLSSDALASKHIIKEYCANVDDGQSLTITFTPKESDFAFVNGIELVSMPTGLYFSPEGGLGAPVVGQKYRFFIDNSTALELVQRLNVGGGSISPVEDSRLFRRWDEDSDYLSETGALTVVNGLKTVSHSHTSISVAPIQVYQTARIIVADTKLSTSNLTWNIPVDMGFRYLVRLHFCEDPSVVSIVINDHVAEKNVGAAAYRDFIAMTEGDKMVGKSFLTITYQHKTKAGDDKFLVPMSALEVFKLSNPDNNLAGAQQVSKLSRLKVTRQHKKANSSYSMNLITAVVTVILSLLNVAAYHIARFVDPNLQRSILSSSVKGPCRRFSIDEIRRSTNYFDPQFQIGSGGYGRVYKGKIDYGATVVAIKRKKTESKQGETEFWTEIKMLSKVRHENLVSLIGYCNEGPERMLIYQYMSRGTLSDHLYNTSRNGNCNPPLPWELRLKVSIGAARGLYYLHSRHRIIHRDVKCSNILLDENWVAKISDFGLSKMGPANDSFTHISTNVKGTFGYLDPEYFLTRRLTKKSDVYAFGVVLFEVLSGRPAVSLRLEDEQHSLAGWARYCIREAKVDRLIDHNLAGQISHASLKVFVGIAGRCLQTTPQGRPAMADVVMALELALAFQQTTDPTDQAEEEEHEKRSYSDQSDGIISMDDTVFKGESDGIVTEDNPSSSRGSDKKNRKSKAKDIDSNNSTPRWWWDPYGFFPRSSSKSKASQQQQEEVLIHQFSLKEVHTATNNLHIIGYGGLDCVYKGYIDGGKKAVAIRWSIAAESRQSMAHELQSKKEIQMNISPTPDHVASLVGYCETESGTILVYNYMANGTLYDHLHEASKEPLPWRRRLQICVGAARGLSFIHSNIKQTILHRELKSTNIWLDEEWIPKVSEWGLTKKKVKNQVPTIMKSKWGYLDSAYIWGEQITEKSYVFSFGVILFELLFAEKESDRWLDEDQVSLAEWIKLSIMTDLSGCIDPFLVGRTSPDSLKTFIETAERCLLDYGTDRPSMNDIVTRLEEALKQQDAAESNTSNQL